MTTAENIAIIGESEASQFRPMLARADRECIAIETDEYEGCAVTDHIFQDGSKLRVCAGHMEAIAVIQKYESKIAHKFAVSGEHGFAVSGDHGMCVF